MTANPRLLLWQCVFCGVSALVFECATAAYTLALTRGSVMEAAIMSALVAFLSAGSFHYFVSAKTVRERVILTAAVALGYSLGTVIVMSLFAGV